MATRKLSRRPSAVAAYRLVNLAQQQFRYAVAPADDFQPRTGLSSLSRLQSQERSQQPENALYLAAGRRQLSDENA